MVGNATSIGDSEVRSDLARELFHVDGTDIKIGIISTSFNALSGLESDVNSGDLPGKENPLGETTPVTNLKDIPSSSPFANDEGRAIAQIIHDIAPGAELSFRTVFNNEGKKLSEVNEESFAKAVSALREEEVNIIINDSIFPAPFFQDGVAAKAVQNATNNGIAFISATGNNDNASYASNFRSGESFSVGEAVFEAHDFDPGKGIDIFQDIAIKENGTLVRPVLSWDEPIGNVESNYEMFLLNSPELPNEENIVSVSNIPSRSALDDPLRSLSYEPEKGEELYLLLARTGTDSQQSNKIKWISLASGLDRSTTYEYIDQDSLNRTVFGQANAPTSITVGASDVDNPQEVRTYTSRGSSPILFDSEGTRLASPALRNKPEIFAPDGVETTFSSGTPFNPFVGTSASAPHVAGVVALMLERAGGNLSPERVSSVLQATSLPTTQNGGFVQANRAITESFLSAYTGSEANDVLLGTSFADNLYGKEGADLLIGNERKDYLVGGSGTDILAGGTGDDALLGGDDSNILLGEKGEDTFILESGGFSFVSDFEIGRDSLVFSGMENAQNLTLSQEANDTLIRYSGDIVARLFDAEIQNNSDITFI
ncbi:MAG: hypothetical protein BRC49_06840 [Cyanobacteria bacterium SW_10_48_33]|nr:MAG: hypothetical protein BRC49_06840 [Cyanobacteria bacterium SW_10_48_33]